MAFSRLILGFVSSNWFQEAIVSEVTGWLILSCGIFYVKISNAADNYLDLGCHAYGVWCVEVQGVVIPPPPGQTLPSSLLCRGELSSFVLWLFSCLFMVLSCNEINCWRSNIVLNLASVCLCLPTFFSSYVINLVLTFELSVIQSLSFIDHISVNFFKPKFLIFSFKILHWLLFTVISMVEQITTNICPLLIV